LTDNNKSYILIVSRQAVLSQKVFQMQKIIIEDVTDYKKLQKWIDSLDPKLFEEYQGNK